MIDKYTRQRDIALISSQDKDNLLLKRLEKMANRMKRATKDEKRTRA